MPMPVSSTSNQSRARLLSAAMAFTRSHTVPSCVYLTAFVRIFVSTWRMRTSSPYSLEGISLEISAFNRIFLSFARCEAILTRS